MPSNTFPSSTIELSSLQDGDTPSLLDLRPFLDNLQDQNAATAFTLVQQALDNIQQTLRGASPRLQQLSIGSADIADLTVSGEFGPGVFQVLNGQPNFDQIGWIGSQPSAIFVVITSIVAGLVTTATPHLLKPGDNVFIESTTVSANTGFYVVATTPLATTFTVTGGIPGGNSTGGDMTRQFQGAWLKSFAAGGTAFDNAPLIIDVDGSLTITDATIILNGATSQIVLDPTTGTISVTQVGGGGPPFAQVYLQSGDIVFQQVGTGAATETTRLSQQNFIIGGSDADGYQIELASGVSGSLEKIFGSASTSALAELLRLQAASAATSNGPVVGFYQNRGSGGAQTATQNGDTVGGMMASSFDGTSFGAYAAAIRAIATQNSAVAAHGTKLVFEVTPNGSNVATNVMTLDQDGSLSVPLKYKVGATSGLGVSRSFGTSISLATSVVGLFGTPGVGQSNGTVVTGVTLNLTGNTFTGGILTA